MVYVVRVSEQNSGIMKRFIIFAFALATSLTSALAVNPTTDWLIDGSGYKSYVFEKDARLVMGNGLMERVFLLRPGTATIRLDNLMTGESELRAVRPEAELVIDGKRYNVGGLNGQPVHNYLSDDFLKDMTMDDEAFKLVDNKVENTKERFPWKKNVTWLSGKADWPAPGKRVTFKYRASDKFPDNLKKLEVDVVYEIYDGAPIMSKQVVVRNKGEEKIVLNGVKTEILALVDKAPKVHSGEPHEIRMLAQEPGAFIQDPKKFPAQTDAPRDYIDRFTQLFVVTDYAMGGDMEAMKDNPAVRWVFDHPEYEATGIRYYGQYRPSRLEAGLPIGPDVEIASERRIEE